VGQLFLQRGRWGDRQIPIGIWVRCREIISEKHVNRTIWLCLVGKCNDYPEELRQWGAAVRLKRLARERLVMVLMAGV